MSLLEVYWRALGYLTPHARQVTLIVSANVMLALVMVAEPILFGRVIDAIAGSGDELLQTGLIWAGLGLFTIVSTVYIARAADRLAHARRLAVLTQSYERIVHMPLSWHQERGTSNVLHTLLRAADALFGLWLEFMRQHLATAIALLFLFPTALVMDWRMSLVLLFLGAAYLGVNRVVMRKTKEGQRAVERHHHAVFAHVGDTIGNLAVLQSYNRLEHESRSLRILTGRLIDAQYPVLDWWAIASGLQRLASTISMITVLGIGAILVSRNELRVGEVVAFIGFANLLIGRLDQITQFVNQVFEARARLESFYDMEDTSSLPREPLGVRSLDRVSGAVRFDNVSFTFPGTGQGVSDISFEVPAGQTVAIVGPTGSGKTTLINLLQRVYDPQLGRITIDGVDTREVKLSSLRDSIATVFQDAGLLDRTIADNIRIGNGAAEQDQIEHAARVAAAHDFVLTKSQAYDTVVGERGGQLSGGERQRLAIARAVLKDAPILVLDEATSALDVETEERVKSAVDELRRGRTTFVIAHRLSTVRDADLVVFLDQGRIQELGSFEALARRGGRFAALLRSGGLLENQQDSRPRLVPMDVVAA